jgi:proline iminopeptidase
MKIRIPRRTNIPATNLYSKIITKPGAIFGERAVMLLIPGGPGGNHTVFDSIIDQLLEYADLILFDPRGCGNSDASDIEYCSLEFYIDDIESIRQHFQLNKMILFGGSYGAMAALGYATKYSKYLDKLILLAGSSSYHFLETAKINLAKHGTPQQIEAAQDLFAGTFKNAEHFAEYYLKTSSLYLFKKAQQQDPPPTLKANIPYNINITNFGFGNFLRKFNFESELKNILCKTLILVGENDWINDPIHSKCMAAGIPNSQLVILAECGHFIWADQRNKFYLALNDFLLENASQLV